MNKDLISIVEVLRVRPCMYLGEKSIIRFSSFMDGYVQACADYELDFPFSEKTGRFTYQMAEKYKIGSPHGWARILLKACNNDDEAAFDLFFKEWDEFCALPEERATDDYDENTAHNEVAE